MRVTMGIMMEVTMGVIMVTSERRGQVAIATYRDMGLGRNLRAFHMQQP
jgi:hypothetical protein